MDSQSQSPLSEGGTNVLGYKICEGLETTIPADHMTPIPRHVANNDHGIDKSQNVYVLWSVSHLRLAPDRHPPLFMWGAARPLRVSRSTSISQR